MIYYTVERLLNTGRVWTRDDFVFFWGHTDRGHGDVTKACLSQWHRCSFTVDGQYYNCAEQYMMAEKARIFGDEQIRQQILKEYDQLAMKKLGRQVANFDGAIWEEKRFDVVVDGNLAKFSQNPKLKAFLLDTGNQVLVEASPKDTIWGIGLAEHEPNACNPSKWKGVNLLGFALMEVRDQLRSQEECDKMHRQFVKYFETIAELHRMGYEKFRVCAYISPNGVGYRCWLTVRQNTWNKCGLFCDVNNKELAVLTHGCNLPWDYSEMSTYDNALRIIQEYPVLSRYALGRDPEYVEWFKLVVEEARNGHYIFAFEEYANALRDGYTLLTMVSGKGLPFPPVGDSETQTMY